MPTDPTQLRRPNLVRALAVACALLTFWGLVYPFNFHHNPDAVWLEPTLLGKINTLVNLLLFVPMGLLGAWAGRSARPNRKQAVLLGVILVGAALSFAGETAQVWLPKRDSSLMDLLANVAGAAAGAWAGWRYAPHLTRWWNAFADWASGHPATQRALVIFFLVGVARLAPFDVSPETFYLRVALQDTYHAGGPFARYRAWLWEDAPDPAKALDAKVELLRAGASLFLFTIASASLVAATRERSLARGERAVPWVSVALVGVGAVCATELLQGLVRSRLMDATDWVAGCAGVAAGLVLGLFAGPQPPRSADDTRERVSKVLLALSLTLALLVAYISLLPLRPRLIPISIAFKRFAADITNFDPSRVNRTDWPLNALAFSLMAFMWCAAVIRPATKRTAAVAWSLTIWAALVAGGLALELLQEFLPARVTTPHDTMSQAAGCAFGVGLWWFAGPRLIRPLVGAVSHRGRATLRPVLQLYLAAYLFYSIMPLDVVVSLRELTGKFHSRSVLPIPFSSLIHMRFIDGWNCFRDVVLAIPIGILASRSRFGSGRFLRPVLACGALFAAVEAAQLFLRSRVSATDDVLRGMVGAGIGIVAAQRGVAWLAHWPRRRHVAMAIAYAAALAVLYATPFRFHADRLTTDTALEYAFTVPFTALQFRPPFPALDDVLFTVLLAVPLGVFLGCSLARWSRSWLDGLWGYVAVVLIAAPWLTLIGLMQIAVAGRNPDPTDALMGTAGAVLGAVLAKRITHEEQTPTTDTPPGAG